METLKSKGRCVYCNNMYSQEEMSKHIATHLKQIEKEKASKTDNAYYLIIEAEQMFLHILIDGEAIFKNLDKFLRDIWVECCGHLSAFNHKNRKISMSHTLNDVLSPKMKFDYVYDFGSSTYLELSVLGQYNIKTKSKIELLSRNEPLKLLCAICKKKSAVVICPFCRFDEYALYCETCSKIHENDCDDFGEDTCLPVVNSPRMGECGYEGGIIDKERDGVFKK